MIKAIETVYNGYRFRSRLEARWAVFFDMLGIKYEYEKEGYDLNGVSYLPDFWLPELKRWIEIKGQEPTEEEKGKAYQLANLTRYPVYIFAGNIDPEGLNCATGYYPLEWFLIGHDPLCHNHDNVPFCDCFESEKTIHLPLEVYNAWAKAERAYKHDIFHITMMSEQVVCEKPASFNQLEGEPYFMPLPNPLNEHEAKLKELISNHPHWLYSLSIGESDVSSDDDFWTECPRCHMLGITYRGRVDALPCPCPHDWEESLRIKAASTAARQARFEHGEKP